MLYKFISDIPFALDSKAVIRFGDTIALCEDNRVKNVTSGELIVLDKIEYGKQLEWILDHSSRIEVGVDESNDQGLYNETCPMASYRIPEELYKKLNSLGLLDTVVRSGNIGTSDYSRHLIQPWSIWKDYNLDPWDADIIKRVLRTKSESGKTADESRIMDYQKIIHVCQEKIRQLTCNKDL